MKKITLLMLSLFFAMTAWAGVTDLPEMSTDSNIVWYTIKNTRSGKYVTHVADNAAMTQESNAQLGSFFYFTASKAETAEGFTPVMIHNAGTECIFADFESWTVGGATWYLSVDCRDGEPAGLHINRNAKYQGWNSWNDGGGSITYYLANDAGSVFVIEQVTDFSTVINVPAAKTAAIATLDNIKNVTVLFDADKIEEVKTAVNSVEAKTNSLEDLNAAIESINAIVATVYTENFTTKNVRFTTDARGNGVDITAVAAGAAEQHNSGDAGIWTLKAVNGGFKMYNFVSNLWMGATNGQSQRVSTVENEADAALYVVNSNDGNKINLMNNGNTLHASGWGGIVQWNDNNAGASIFLVAVEPEITVVRDVYVNANAAKANLPYAIQQAYGLVTDASNYYSNYKSTAEGSYEALLDNVEGSYFHSAYNDEPGDGSGVHYIQANLGAGNSVDEFYFYMKPRSGNGNNRPVDIIVAGSNDNVEYTKIADVKTTLDGTMTPYVSAKLGTAGTNYQYIRLTVTSTNTSTKFFTLSELYFFPATRDVENLVNAYSGLATTSITSEDYAPYANALINAETTLALANIKKEIATILTSNATNHAEKPALGQYTTAAYNALTAANDDANATQESLEAAIAAFKKAKNSPVFTISGTKDYVVGKSLYEDEGNTNGKGNDCYFKTTNKYDKTMWWVFDQTSTTVGVTESVAVVNYATGNPIWGVENLKITETDPANADDGVFLFYSVGNDTPLHFQADGAVLCRYDSYTADSGSAATFTYVGNSYDLDKLTDEHITALSALQSTYDAKAPYADVVIGTELGEYSGNRDTFAEAKTNAETILTYGISDLANTEISYIESVKTTLEEAAAALTLNMPVPGKYYYLKCNNYYLSNVKGATLTATQEKTINNIFYYESDGENTYLLSYESGEYVTNPWNIGVGEDRINDNEIYKQKKIFVEGQPGKYALEYLANNGQKYYFNVNNGATNAAQDKNADNAQWTIEEVSSLPVTICEAKYATFYAPVAVTVPENIIAYTVTVDGDRAILTEVGNTIPANTGVVLQGNAGDYNFDITTTTETVDTDLEGTVAATYITADAYVLGYINDEKTEVGFATATTTGQAEGTFLNNSHKAYLPMPAGSEGVSFYSILWGNEEENTTAIENVETATVNVIYDLSGRRVNEITEKGIYIVGGRKVLVK